MGLCEDLRAQLWKGQANSKHSINVNGYSLFFKGSSGGGSVTAKQGGGVVGGEAGREIGRMPACKDTLQYWQSIKVGQLPLREGV